MKPLAQKPTRRPKQAHGDSPPRRLTHNIPRHVSTVQTRLTYHRRHGEEVRVITALLQVHHDVEQRDLVPTTF